MLAALICLLVIRLLLRFLDRMLAKSRINPQVGTYLRRGVKVLLCVLAVILVCGLGFSSGLTFTVFGTSITLTGLAIAALAGIILNAILPGNDYEFGKDLKGDINRGVTLKPNPEEIK